MPSDLPSRAYELFQAALEKPAEERSSFIAAADPEIAEIAAQMLRDFEQEADDDVQPPFPVPEWAGDREGSLVNGWHVEDHLSPGGYGRVYRAWRSTTGGREEAAIKFLDMAPGEVPRFLRERQTLADLNHAGICKFIDGGTTSGGVPFMVMEYVAGLPISRFCDHHRKTITERLKLFLQLCHATEYAHQHRVLHRDLKPANILVTAAGSVRVLDFGVAKLLDPAGGAERLTKPGDTPWTKSYASPEQVKGEELSFATDVYALGVVLYELLTGQLPFSDFSLNGPDWMRVVCEREPLPPSQALLVDPSESDPAAGPALPETAAGLRRSTPSRLKQVLAGNLDAVVLKALRKDPRQRYSRVDRLRFDIERFLEGLPVSARPSGRWERVRTWSLRHPLTAAAMTAGTLWTFLMINMAFVRRLEYNSVFRDEQSALERIQYLTETALPSLEKALPLTPDDRELRQTVARIHRDLLEQVESLPNYTLMNLDSSLAISALQCSREWSDLGDPAAALAITTPVLPRVARFYDLDHNDRQWRELYSRLLRRRIELRSLLQQDAQNSEDSRRLAELESRHR